MRQHLPPLSPLAARLTGIAAAESECWKGIASSSSRGIAVKVQVTMRFRRRPTVYSTRLEVGYLSRRNNIAQMQKLH
jgi:hypothetical protein